MLFHPAVARINCSDCLKVVYDFDTGEPVRICNGTLPMLRVLPPPCEKCPKKSPEREREFVLSDRNLKTIRLYYEVRATGGACLTERERSDRLLTRNLQLIDRLVREHERKQQTDDLLNILQLVATR